MFRLLALASALLCALTINAEARQRHRTYLAHPDCNITMPCEGVTTSQRGERVVKAMRGFGSAQKVYKPRAAAVPRSRVAAVRHEIPSYGAPRPSIEYSINRPARYIAGRLICAVNVGAALAERGIRGTGSALALSYLHWGRSAGGPVPGAVIVSSRRGGGHVAIVSRIQNGIVYAWNATGGQRGWREIPYRHRVLDYRVPG
jgi:hypothetical protein